MVNDLEFSNKHYTNNGQRVFYIKPALVILQVIYASMNLRSNLRALVRQLIRDVVTTESSLHV